jgi:hypothetical protein
MGHHQLHICELHLAMIVSYNYRLGARAVLKHTILDVERLQLCRQLHTGGTTLCIIRAWPVPCVTDV